MAPLPLHLSSLELPTDHCLAAFLTPPCQRHSRRVRPPPLTKRLSGSLDSIMTSYKLELRMDVTALSVRKRSFNNLAEAAEAEDETVLVEPTPPGVGRERGPVGARARVLCWVVGCIMI